MPVIAAWHDQANTIVRVDIRDPWTLNEMSEAIRVSRQLMNSVNYGVDAIWNGSETKGMPSNVLSHFMFPNEDTNIPRNQEAVVVVVRGAFLQKFVLIAKRLLPQITKNMHITHDLPAAEQKIEALRQQRGATEQ